MNSCSFIQTNSLIFCLFPNHWACVGHEADELDSFLLLNEAPSTKLEALSSKSQVINAIDRS